MTFENWMWMEDDFAPRRGEVLCAHEPGESGMECQVLRAQEQKKERKD
jgi:hypothetical protein